MNNKNKFLDLYIKYQNRKISQEKLELQICRRCIDNINNWYIPKKVGSYNLDSKVEKDLIFKLINHNKSIVGFLETMIKYSGIEKEKVENKINEYNRTIVNQELRYKNLFNAERQGGTNDKERVF